MTPPKHTDSNVTLSKQAKVGPESGDRLPHPDAFRMGRRAKTCLLILVLVGVFIRAVPVMWGSTYYHPVQFNFHPDEPKIVRYVDDFPGSLITNHDYRYPTAVHNVYGLLWSGLRAPFESKDLTPSMPGAPSYERTLLATRIFHILIFGLGGLLLLFAFARRLWGSGVAIFATAAASVQGWVVSSTALAQTDIPAATLLLGLFMGLLKTDRAQEIHPKRGLTLGVLLGAATAMKYTAAIGVIGILFTALSATRRKAMAPWATAGFLGMSAVGFALSFGLFVPAIVFDTQNVVNSILWEFKEKAAGAQFSLEHFWQAFKRCLPLWILIPSVAGFALALVRTRGITLWSIGVTLGLYMWIMSRSMQPDYVLPWMPFAAAFSGYLFHSFFRIQAIPRAIKALPIVYLTAGIGHSGWTVYQRYASDTHYLFDTWVHENITTRNIGDGPYPLRRSSFAANCPEGYQYLRVYKKPRWVALFKRHYLPAQWVIEDPNHYPQYPQVIGSRQLGNFKERDFLFYEDVLFDMRREYKYDLVHRFDPVDLPLDMQGETILIYRKTDEPKKNRKPSGKKQANPAPPTKAK